MSEFSLAWEPQLLNNLDGILVGLMQCEEQF